MGIPRAHRLRRSRDLTRVRTQGRSWANHWLVLIALPNALDRVRVGVTASRRVGGAVVRVRARRLIREAVRPWINYISGNWDLVFIARSALADASFHEVERAVAQLLRRADLVSGAE